MILVTGAMGNNGLEVVKRLAKHNVPVRFLRTGGNRRFASYSVALYEVTLVKLI